MKREVLSNGAAILSLKRQKDYTARIIIASKLGYVNEPRKKKGLAHLLEHAILSANIKKYNFIRVAEILDSLGSYQNGRTGYESVSVYGYTQKTSFEKFSDIMSEICLEPQFNSKAFRTEKNIILTEYKGHLDDPCKYISSFFLRGLYKKGPLRTSIQDKIRALKRITLGDAIKAHKTYFSPNNLVVGIFGNFKLNSYNKMKDKIERLQNGSHRNGNIPKGDMKPFRKRTVEKKVDMKQVYIQTGVKTATVESEDMHALRIISTLLTCGDSSRLFNQLRLKRGLVYFVHSKNIIGKDYGFFYVKTGTQKNKGKESLKIIKNEFRKLRNQRVSRRELKKAKNMIIGLRKAEYDNPLRGPLRFVRNEIVLGNVNRERENMKKLKKVTEEEVHQVAKKYFSEDSFSTAIIRPK
ncbi:MAG: pitrilysin family protein [Candidatus Aenigmatarchaeota archaeon]